MADGGKGLSLALASNFGTSLFEELEHPDTKARVTVAKTRMLRIDFMVANTA